MIYEGEMGIIGNSEKNESDEKKKNGSKTVEKHKKKRKNIDSEKNIRDKKNWLATRYEARYGELDESRR